MKSGSHSVPRPRHAPDADATALLQQRLALFGRWFFIVAAGYYFVANLPLDWVMGYPFDWITEWFGAQERATLAIVGCAAVVWLATRGRALPLPLLEAIDAFAVIVPLNLMGVAVTLGGPGDATAAFTAVLGSTNGVIVRAIVVPSTPRRTVLLGALSMVGVIAATVYTMSIAADLPRRPSHHVAISVTLWAFVAVGCSGVISHILFRLRSEVAEVRKLGQYTLHGRIGQGAVGIVYRATHVLLRRPTAIKLLAPSKNREADLRRFEREVRLTARLTHPNTIAVYDYGRSPDGVFYYAMEYIDGLSFEQLVQHDGPQPAWRVIHIMRQACGALEEAHRAGLIHRDIKPANLMLCSRGGVPDVVKVLDFGLVKPLATGGNLSMVDSAVGTPLYMSPEAIESPDKVDAKSDVYGLGATAYFLLTGTPVFSAPTVVAICSKHLGEAPEAPSKRLGAAVDADLEAVILACLAKKPADRPASAADLERRLAACAAAGQWSPEKVAGWWETLVLPESQPGSDSAPGQLTIELARQRAT